MSLPVLDDRLEAFHAAEAALKVLRRLLKPSLRRRLGISDVALNELLQDTELAGLTTDEAREKLRKADEELPGLGTVSLFATFEFALREHLKGRLRQLAPDRVDSSPKSPANVPEALLVFLEKEAMWWKMDELLELAKPFLDTRTAGETAQALHYRNYIAHRSRPAAPVRPERAHKHLSECLDQVTCK